MSARPKKANKHFGHVYHGITHNHVYNRWTAVWERCRAFRTAICRLIVDPDSSEKPKYIQRRHFRRALTSCAVHLLPLMLLIVVSCLQISGFYIGETLEGFHGEHSESVKFLALQVAAKLYELLVIASLTTIVVDVIRSRLITSDLPFGLLTAHLDFKEPSFFWSVPFMSSYWGFRRRRHFALIASLLLVSGVIALLSGPAAATLLIPVYRDRWSAGGTDFWLAGNFDSLWPTKLSVEHIGGPHCFNPRGVTVPWQTVSDAGCIWDGAGSLIQNYRDSHQIAVANMTISDGFGSRILQRRSMQVAEAYTIAPFAAVANPSNNFGIAWAKALSAIRGASSYAHYQRLGRTGFFEMESHVPIVRTRCFFNLNMTSPDDYWKYPYLPQVGRHNATPAYHIPKRPIVNMTLPYMVWIIANDTSGATLNGQTPTHYPSAFLNVQIPSAQSLTDWSGLLSCSIDARWIKSVNVGRGFDVYEPGEYATHAQMPDQWFKTDGGNSYPWTDDILPKTGSIAMDETWLNTLTPEIAPSLGGYAADVRFTGYTTLSDMFRAMGVNNGYTALEAHRALLESVISTTVADGLSRIGYSVNGGHESLADFQHHVVDRYNISFAAESAWAKAVYRGTASTPFPPGHDASNATLMRWNAYIGGYSYRADGVAYWLALSLLYVHAVLAVGHIVWRLSTSLSSDSWDNALDLIALAAGSESSDLLANTCGGVKQGKTLATTVGVREIGKEPLSSGREQVQLVFSADRKGVGFRPTARRVEDNVKYGVV